MTIPQIRAELLILATIWPGPYGARLAYLAIETKRRRAVRRAPNQRYNKITHAQARAYLAIHPDADYHEIAAHYGTNIGRVSEALRGKRT